MSCRSNPGEIDSPESGPGGRAVEEYRSVRPTRSNQLLIKLLLPLHCLAVPDVPAGIGVTGRAYELRGLFQFAYNAQRLQGQ